MGSKNEVNKAPVLKVTNATETLDTLIAIKKVTQCSDIINPPNINLSAVLGSIFSDFFLNKKYSKIKTEANNMRYQTNGMASMLIKAPKIAVKPQMKTMRCKCK